MEGKRRSAHNPFEQKQAEEILSELKFALEMEASQEQQCQSELVETETQFHAERTNINDLEDLLDTLDRMLAGNGSK